MGDLRGWSRTVRARATVVATTVVALALAIAALTVVALQRDALIEGVDASLRSRADEVASLVPEGSIPRVLDLGAGGSTLLQVVDAQGHVVAASRDLTDEGRIAGTEPLPGTDVLASGDLPFGDDGFRILSRGVEGPDGVVVIHAAASLEPVAESIGSLGAILFVGVPILIALVGMTTWLIVGRALRPVESIRSRVSSIGDGQLDRRVPVPDTGDEVARLAHTMNGMLERLERSAERQRRFVADASHELRSPLAAMRTQLEVGLAHPDGVDWPTVSSEVLEEALRLQRLVDDLLLLARRESEAVVVTRAPVDLDDLVFDHVHRLGQVSVVSFDTGGVSGGQVLGNRSELDRLVRNLLENSVRHAASRVVVGLGEIASEVTLSIDDDGTGIAEEDRLRVFDRFTRLDGARDRDHGGSGLGLALVRDVTEDHGGVVVVEASTLGGARFVVRLPAVR